MNRAERRARARGRSVGVLEVCLNGSCCDVPSVDDLPADLAALLGLTGERRAGAERTGRQPGAPHRTAHPADPARYED